MCGIIGAVAQRDIAEILIEGLRRLEYRGYDSAGMAVINRNGCLQKLREVGKVEFLAKEVNKKYISGGTGIAHTRWATHGVPCERNAHPHTSDYIAVVHNGIIENYLEIKKNLQKLGYIFNSDTDTEVIAHLVHYEYKKCDNFKKAVQCVTKQLFGVYSIVIMDSRISELLIGACSGNSLIIGLGVGENFFASDKLALLPVTRRFIYLEEGDIAELRRRSVRIFDKNNVEVKRKEIESNIHFDVFNKGNYRHYMQKEIYEQPTAIKQATEGRFTKNNTIDFGDELGIEARKILYQIEHIQIVACGTSYNAGMVARYWFESLANISCDVEIASEYRYRKHVYHKNSLMIVVSQSGETADTLAALRLSNKLKYLTSLAICNVTNSSLVRESKFSLITKAGPEIGVASTKAFTTQLTVLLMLVAYIGSLKNIKFNLEKNIINALCSLPAYIESFLLQYKIIEKVAEDFLDKQHALFLGRGLYFPIAVEGALKLKEVSYIHAEAYAAGELKHGPLALINTDIPVIIIAPNNKLLEKLKSNVEEVRARGGLLYIFTDENAGFISKENMKIILLPNVNELVAPIFYIIPLQLLAYHVSLIKGTDIDQPRNLAKSVTVE
ncbi:Glutamine--fructose-6-phosphate aminotransferase[isomerizing] [Candidatus Providencia siddallii]|uniref:Glutamine--fructose-6-phosphate aminotransferase [isomerizing] n=1 Tax=Candidatus Providencia siddallii TaxID=1715285 RepID=A0A0M6W9P4_9GAMM|nr:Glutamine--fructose-6-phosphate aminotransferase[isomerizing] [Candidatus Providencia siddallii]